MYIKIFVFVVMAFIASATNLHAQDKVILTSERVGYLTSKANTRTIDKAEIKEFKQYAFTLQNKAFNRDEISHNYQSALRATDSALNIWVILRDTLNEANMRKYKGYLLGHLNKFPEAKTELFKAIDLFRSKHFPSGIAVSQFDLSKVYEREKKLDSAFYYVSLSRNFWMIKKDTLRMANINNELMRILIGKHQFKDTEVVQREQTDIFSIKILDWHPMIDFYFLSGVLYQELRKNELADHYKELYIEKLKELKAGGIVTRSEFDD